MDNGAGATTTRPLGLGVQIGTKRKTFASPHPTATATTPSPATTSAHNGEGVAMQSESTPLPIAAVVSASAATAAENDRRAMPPPQHSPGRRARTLPISPAAAMVVSPVDVAPSGLSASVSSSSASSSSSSSSSSPPSSGGGTVSWHQLLNGPAAQSAAATYREQHPLHVHMAHLVNTSIPLSPLVVPPSPIAQPAPTYPVLFLSATAPTTATATASALVSGPSATSTPSATSAAGATNGSPALPTTATASSPTATTTAASPTRSSGISGTTSANSSSSSSNSGSGSGSGGGNLYALSGVPSSSSAPGGSAAITSVGGASGSSSLSLKDLSAPHAHRLSPPQLAVFSAAMERIADHPLRSRLASLDFSRVQPPEYLDRLLRYLVDFDISYLGNGKIVRIARSPFRTDGTNTTTTTPSSTATATVSSTASSTASSSSSTSPSSATAASTSPTGSTATPATVATVTLTPMVHYHLHAGCTPLATAAAAAVIAPSNLHLSSSQSVVCGGSGVPDLSHLYAFLNKFVPKMRGAQGVRSVECNLSVKDRTMTHHFVFNSKHDLHAYKCSQLFIDLAVESQLIRDLKRPDMMYEHIGDLIDY